MDNSLLPDLRSDIGLRWYKTFLASKALHVGNASRCGLWQRDHEQFQPGYGNFFFLNVILVDVSGHLSQWSKKQADQPIVGMHMTVLTQGNSKPSREAGATRFYLLHTNCIGIWPLPVSVESKLPAGAKQVCVPLFVIVLLLFQLRTRHASTLNLSIWTNTTGGVWLGNRE